MTHTWSGAARRYIQDGAQCRICSVGYWLLVTAVVLLSISGCGDRTAEQRGRAARQLGLARTALLAASPSRAATSALEADLLSHGPATELGMIDVAAEQADVERVLVAHRGRAFAAVRIVGRMMSSGEDGRVRIRDSRSGRLLGETSTSTPPRRLVTSDKLEATVAGLKGDGGVSLWDLSDPTRPHEQRLPGSAEDVVALGFSPSGATLIAVGRRGRVRRWDVARRIELPSSDLRDAQGRLPWAGQQPSLVAGELSTTLVDRAPKLTVATADGAVAAVDLSSMRGRTVVRSGLIDAPATSIVTAEFADYDLVVGTTRGVRLQSAADGQILAQDRGTSVTGLAVIDDQVVVAGSNGTSRLSLSSPYSTADPSGPAVTSLSGDEHPTAANADGTVSLLGRTGAGIELARGPASAVVATGADRTLLVSDGSDPNHVDHLAAVPLDRGRPDEFAWGRARQTYRPARSWWPQGDGDSDHWFVGPALMTHRLVIAAGQDPTGAAVALVWDARTGRPLRRLQLTTGGVATEEPSLVSGLWLSDDGKTLGLYNRVAESFAIFSTSDWERLRTLYVGRLAGFTTTPDGSTLIASTVEADEDVANATTPTALRFIDAASGRTIRTRRTRGPHAIELSPDGRSLAVVAGGALRLFDPEGRKPRTKPVDIEDASPAGLAWRPDGRLIAVARTRGDVILVDPRTGESSVPLKTPDGSTPNGLEWTDDGRTLIAGNFEVDATPPSAARPSLWDLDENDLRIRMCALGALTPSAQEWSKQVAVEAVRPKPICPPSAESPDGTRALPVDPVVAYRSGSRLYAADADGHRALLDETAEDYPSPSFTWSPSGALGWVRDGRAHELRSGHERSWTCPCASVAYDGETLEAVDEDANGLLRFTEDGVGGRVLTGLPRFTPRIVAASSDLAVASAFDEPSDRSSPSGLWSLSGHSAQRFATTRGGSLNGDAVSDPDGTTAAVRISSSGGACYTVDSVALIDLRRLRVSYPAMPEAVNYSRLVRSLSWPHDGTLRAVTSPLACSVDSPTPRTEPLGHVLELRDGALTETKTTSFDERTARGIGVSVRGPLPAGTTRGPLTVGTTVVDRAADDVSVRP